MFRNPITVDGKTYQAESQLTAERIHPQELIYRDAFGRRVLVIHKLFPCFDVYDVMHENRYFHDYYIETDAGYVCVRTADDFRDPAVSRPLSREALIDEHGAWHGSLLVAAGVMSEEELEEEEEDEEEE